MHRPVLFILGWLTFALGMLGAFLPVIPTTPFLLLTAYCFSKSSPRFHRWVLSLPVFGVAIEDWRTRKVIRPKAKLMCALMIAVSLTLLWLRESPPIAIKLPVSLTLLAVGFFVLTRKSC